MKHDDIKPTAATPLLLRRLEEPPTEFEIGGEVVANMTVVTTQGNSPEMHDQKSDKTAPRND